MWNVAIANGGKKGGLVAQKRGELACGDFIVRYQPGRESESAIFDIHALGDDFPDFRVIFKQIPPWDFADSAIGEL